MKQKRETSAQVGRWGEDTACTFLVKRGFTIVERNYRKKWGEIDVIVRKGDTLHFVEVKSVSTRLSENVSHETDRYRPEDNIHPAKLRRLSRTIQTYLIEMREEGEWQFDAITVRLDVEDRTARVSFMENIIL